MTNFLEQYLRLAGTCVADPSQWAGLDHWPPAVTAGLALSQTGAYQTLGAIPKAGDPHFDAQELAVSLTRFAYDLGSSRSLLPSGNVQAVSVLESVLPEKLGIPEEGADVCRAFTEGLLLRWSLAQEEADVPVSTFTRTILSLSPHGDTQAALDVARTGGLEQLVNGTREESAIRFEERVQARDLIRRVIQELADEGAFVRTNSGPKWVDIMATVHMRLVSEQFEGVSGRVAAVGLCETLTVEDVAPIMAERRTFHGKHAAGGGARR